MGIKKNICSKIWGASMSLRIYEKIESIIMQKRRLIFILVIISILFIGCSQNKEESFGLRELDSQELGNLGEKMTASTNSNLSPQVVNIVLMNFESSYPLEIKIQKDSTLVIENKGEQTYTFTLEDGTIDSGNITSREKWSYKFKERGTFGYYSKYHENIKGNIIIE